MSDYVRPPVPACALFHDTNIGSSFGIVIAKNGARNVRSVCDKCGRVGNHSYPHARFTPEERAAFPVVRDNRTAETALCERCASPNVELHHYAPRHLFGLEEADMWPTGWLCPPCHRYWHQMVTPNMSRRTVG